MSCHTFALGQRRSDPAACHRLSGLGSGCRPRRSADQSAVVVRTSTLQPGLRCVATASGPCITHHGSGRSPRHRYYRVRPARSKLEVASAEFDCRHFAPSPHQWLVERLATRCLDSHGKRALEASIPARRAGTFFDPNTRRRPSSCLDCIFVCTDDGPTGGRERRQSMQFGGLAAGDRSAASRSARAAPEHVGPVESSRVEPSRVDRGPSAMRRAGLKLLLALARGC